MAGAGEPEGESEVLQPEDEEFVCTVCLNVLLDPTTLTCGHNICRGCLAGWFLSGTPRRLIDF